LANHESKSADELMAAVGTRVASGRATRSRILEAAIERFAQTGPDASFEEIAGVVGVTKGALYHHFGSKQHLVEDVYREVVRRHAARVVAASSKGSGRERLEGLISESAKGYGSGSPVYRLLLRLHVEAGTVRPYLTPIARRVQARQREYMAMLVKTGQEDGSIRDDVDADTMGQTINAALQGFLVQQVEPPDSQRRAAEAFGELLGVLI
jgi:AcrR family transcriptional regulator